MPILGSTLVSRLRPSDISRAYDVLLKRLSKRTVRHCHWQLHGALELAVRWDQIPVNMAARVDPPEADAFEGRALSRDEVTSLLESIRTKPLAPLVMLALDTGAREGELLALRWSDVDFDSGVIHIGRSVRRIKEAFVFTEPKTRRSRRTVGMSAPQSPCSGHTGDDSTSSACVWANCGRTLTSSSPRTPGLPRPAVRSHAFKNAARSAGFDGLRFHDLRHSSVSLLLASGESMADVSRRAGHSGIGVTVDTYGHKLGVGASLAAAMGSILEESVTDPGTWLANG